MTSASDLEATRAHEEPLILERHGIDYIPPDERHGKPNTLFTFWAASNVQILAVSVGVLAIVFGLSLPWAIFAIVVGNAAGGLYMALHSVQGPRLGLPQMIQSRAQFGMYGTALPNIIVVLMYIGYFTSSAILGGQAVASLLHVTTAEGIIIINAFVLLITWFGYDMFHTYNRIVTYLSTAMFVAILVKLLTILPAHQAAGDNSAGNILLAISVFVAWQVTWAPYVSDYSRYMPENTPAVKTFAYTYVGSVAGASLCMCIGAVAAVAAKGAVLGLIKSLAMEVAQSAIRVNAVAPGPTDTPLLAPDSLWREPSYLSTLPLGRLVKPSEIASAVYYLATEGSMYCGEVLSPNAGAVI